MVVANTLTVGHSAVPPSPQIRASSSFEAANSLYKKPSHNLPSRFFDRRSRYCKLSYCCGSTSDNRSDFGECENNSSVSVYSSCSSSRDWDWNRWTRHFSDIEVAENDSSILKFQLDDAIEKEDFEEAAKLKLSISETTSKDSIAEIMSDLKNAIIEERYHDASRLCRDTGSGLVGWWVGYSKDKGDPFGRMIHISPGVGRFVAKCYSPRQLVTSSPGTPLFEIYVIKDGNGTYKMQAVFLKKNKRDLKKLSSSFSDSSEDTASAGEKNHEATVVDVKLEEGKPKKGEKKSIDFEGAAEEGIKSVINFLKEKIPELNVKVMKVDVAEDITKDTVKEFIEDDNDSSIAETSDEDEVSELEDQVIAEGDSEVPQEEDNNNFDMKLYIGGILHNKEDGHMKDEITRVPASIVDMEKDSFVLHIPSADNENEVNISAKVKVAALAAQNVSDLMPPEVAMALLNSGKVSRKVAKDVREIFKLAVSQAQKGSALSEFTTFNRITTSSSDLDPFEGLYVGAFGPYGSEIVQLRRKYGNWKMVGNEDSSDVEFFEYVEAVKLTGDFNVPAGQVTFRAKIGKSNRSANRGAFPHELGVVATYKGQGRIADFEFRNPKWVEGELLQLNGKGLGPYIKGADLGFLFVAPEQNFLVLFSRLRLPA